MCMLKIVAMPFRLAMMLHGDDGGYGGVDDGSCVGGGGDGDDDENDVDEGDEDVVDVGEGGGDRLATLVYRVLLNSTATCAS